eukprot:g357.t1
MAISVYDCMVDQDGNGVNEGLQIGIYNTTDCNSWSLVSNCDDQVLDNTTQNFTANNLTIGGIYFIVVDGAFGDICSFDIDVVSGSTTAPDVDDTPAEIFSDLEVCQGGSLDVSAEEIFGAGAYLWTLDGDQVATDLNSTIQFPSDLGTYTLCVFPYNPCDDGVESCVDIEVVEPQPEPLFETICEGDEYTIGGESYSEADVYDIVIPVNGDCDQLFELNLAVNPIVETFLEEEICVGDVFEIGNEEFTEDGSYDVVLENPETGCDSIVYLDLTLIGTFEITPIVETICGDDFDATGTYTVQLVADNGCDSIVTLNLNVLEVIIEDDSASICDGDTYTHDGNDYTMSGVYDHPYTASNGCDSIYRLTLTVLPNSIQTIDPVICSGDTFSFGGNDYTMTDTYVVTLPSANGCDSVTTINLTVQDQITSTEDIFLCPGESVTIDGTDIDATGSYDFSYTSVGGCDSLATVNVTVADSIITNLQETICQGISYTVGMQDFDMTGTVFEIGGDELSTAGQYMYSFVSAAGCDSVVTVNLQVDDALINELTETICEGESFPVGGNNYTMTGMYENSFITPEGCDSIVRLDLTVIPTVYNTLTERICIGESFPVGGMDFDASGIYTVTVPAASGCDSVVTLNLTVVDIADTPLSASICDGGTYTIGDSTFMVAGTYTIPLTSVDGCDSLVVLDLNVTDFYETNLNVALCEGESYTVGPDTYDMTGMYTNNFLSQDGCDSIVNLNLTVNPILRDTLVEEVCAGESFSIAGVPYTTTGEHTETIASLVTGCDSIITLFLTVNPVENVTISETICDGESVMVGDSVYTVTGSYFTPLTTEAGCDSIVTLNLNVVPIPITNLTEEICDGESFTVGPDTYTTSGQYTNVLTSVVSGCDSIVNLDLIVHPLPVTTIAAEICEGEVYTIGGVDYNTTGMHEEVVLSMVTGCDSTIMLDLTVHPVYDEMMMATICEGESVMVGDSTYTETGVWPTLMSTVEGCDSLVTLDLTVLPILETDLQETLCAGETYTVGTSTYSMTGTYVDVLTSSLGCDSIVTLDLVVPDPIETFLVEAICDDDDYTVGTDVFTETGEYTVVLTSVETGCDSTVYLNLTVNPTFLINLDETICVGETFPMGGVDYDQTGMYTANLSTVEGCDSTVMLNLTVIPCVLEFTTSLTANDCQGGSNGSISFTMTTGTPPYTYTWSGGNGTIDANNTAELLSGVAAGPYQIVVTDANDFQTVISVTVEEPTAVTVALSGSSYGVYGVSCADALDGSISATANGGTPPYSYTWSNGGANNTIDDLAAGTYELVVTDANGCTATAAMTLSAPQPLSADLSVESPFCDDANGGTVSIDVVSGGTGPYLYTVDGAPYTPGQFFAGLTVGDHVVSVQDANGCEVQELITVNPAPILTVDLGDDIEMMYGDSVNLFAQTSYPVETYKWDGGPIAACDTCANPLIKPNESVAYSVTVTDENGCTATDRVTVFVRKSQDVYIPNAFSPDDDGANDIFMIFGNGQAKEVKSFYIFNRWGESMYEAFGFLPNDPAAGWDGRHRGELLNAGVYIYMAEVEFQDGEIRIYKGDVVLMR